MNITEKPKIFYGYIVVLIAFLCLVVMHGTRASFGVFFLPVLTEFGWTRAMTSGAFSLAMLLGGLIGIGVGRLNDRFGPRLVVTICGFFFGSGYLLMSQISAIWQLYLFYGVIIGIGMSGLWIPLFSTISRWFVKRRGMMTGVVLMGASAGSMIIPPLANWLISVYSWRTSYTVVGIVVLVIVILAAQFLKRDPSKMGLLPYGGGEVEVQRLNLQAKGFSLQQAIKTRQFWMLILINFCRGVSFQAIWVHIVPHTVDLGITAAKAATILVIMGGVSIAGRFIMGSAGDRIGYKPVCIISFIMMTMALFWLLVANEIWMLYLFAVIFGFGYSGLGVLLGGAPMVAHLFGLGSLGVIMGVIGLGWTGGSAVGPALAGGIFDITDSYQLAWLICSSLAVVGVIVTSLLKPIRARRG